MGEQRLSTPQRGVGSAFIVLFVDWIQKYNHPVYLLETFVQKDRFKGTCYKASNWIYLGDTKGRTRNGRNHDPKAPIKEVLVYPLHRHFRELLLHESLPGK